MHCDNCMGGDIDSTYTYCGACLEAGKKETIRKARADEREDIANKLGKLTVGQMCAMDIAEYVRKGQN